MAVLCALWRASVKSLSFSGWPSPLANLQNFDRFDRFRLVERQDVAGADALSGFIGFARLAVLGNSNAFAADIVSRDRSGLEKPCAPKPNINADAARFVVTHQLVFQPRERVSELFLASELPHLLPVQLVPQQASVF